MKNSEEEDILLDLRKEQSEGGFRKFIEIFIGQDLAVWQEAVVILMIAQKRPYNCHRENSTLQ